MKPERIKEIRKEKGYTLADLAVKTGYTASYLSQIERSLKNPSLEALRKISKCLEVPIITFLFEEQDHFFSEGKDANDEYNYFLIRQNERKKMVIPEINTEYEFITPINSPKLSKLNMMGFYLELKPKFQVSEKLVTHQAEESIFVIEGKVDVYVADKVFLLKRRDSFYIKANTPHNIINNGEKNAVILVYQSPAMY